MLYNPDGSKRASTPLDGEVFYDSTASGIVKWMFIGLLGQWFNISNGYPSTPNNAYVPVGSSAPVFVNNPQSSPSVSSGWYITSPMSTEFDGDINFNWGDIELDKPKCECGSDACGHPAHSSWCAKFQANL